MRSEQEVSQAIARYADTVQRLCMLYLKNHADTEDIFQTVFLKYALGSVVFESEEHEKAWILRVTINACKDLLRSFFRSRTVSLEEVLDQPAPLTGEDREVWAAVLALPDGPDSGQEPQHGLHPADPGPADAAPDTGR